VDLAFTLKSSAQVERKAEEAPTERYALPRFKRALEDRPEDAILHPDTVREELAKPQHDPYRILLHNFSIRPDDWTQPDLDPLACDLPLWKNNPGLKMTDPSRPQPRYQMQLWLEAIDTDLDSDKTKDGKPQPHLKVSEEKFTFFLVSENELLAEIAKEEEKQYGDLDTMYQQLLETQAKLGQTYLDLSGSNIKAENLGASSARADQVNEVLEKGQIATRAAYDVYARILREMKTNQVSPKLIDKVEKNIVDPLKNVDRTFDTTRESVTAFRTALDSKDTALPERVAASRTGGAAAKDQMLVLTRAIEKILGAMQKMTDINDLIKRIAEIEKNEAEQYDTIKKIYEQKEDDLFNKATGGDKPAGKK
jgi:hypothetical protein